MASLDALNEARLATEAAAKATAAKGLTQEQIDAATAAVVAAGGKSTDRANRLPGETAAEANARITAGYKAQAQPELTVEGAAAGATIEFVRTAAGGIGTYKEVFPIGTPIPATRTTNSGNVYDAQGNLVSGTGLKAPGTGNKSVVSTVKNPDGSTTITYNDGTTAILPKTPTVFTTKSISSSIKNSDGSTTITYSDGTTEIKPAIVVTGNVVDTTGAPTTNIDIVKAALRGLGFTSAIIDSSTSFLNSLIKEGLDLDNATEVFLNSKDYTLKNGSKITSPFYTEYGYLNEGLVTPKSANELFNTVEGIKCVVDKYKLSSKYLSQDNLKLYVKNDITVTDMAQRAAMAELRALEADPFQVDALIKQGYISSAADLKDFYLDPKVGQQQLELNRQTGVFTAEALRRAKSGISSSGLALDRYKQITATLVAQGYSEAEITKMASTGFENIAQDLNPTVALAQIYEKAGGTGESNALLQSNIQSQLEAEQFGGTASERRKRLAGQNIAAFEGSSGLYSRYGVSGSLSGPGTTGLI